jgi:hypothetical protein
MDYITSSNPIRSTVKTLILIVSLGVLVSVMHTMHVMLGPKGQIILVVLAGVFPQ